MGFSLGASLFSPTLGSISEWLPVVKTNVTLIQHLLYVVLVIFSGLARRAVANLNVVLLYCTRAPALPFSLVTSQSLGRVDKYVKHFWVLYCIEIGNNADVLRISNLGVIPLHANAFRIKGFNLPERIWGQGILTFAKYVMGEAFDENSLFLWEDNETIFGVSSLFGKISNYYDCWLYELLPPILYFYHPHLLWGIWERIKLPNMLSLSWDSYCSLKWQPDYLNCSMNLW